MTYDDTYKEIENVFGTEPDRLLKEYYKQIDKSRPVLDIGAGQGRNTFFLAENGFAVDAIDPSRVSIEIINKIKTKERYNINAYQQDFNEFGYRNSPYSAILVFGLLQILDLKSVSLLIDLIDKYSDKGSLIFMTAFSIKDSSLKKYEKEWSKVGRNSYTNDKGIYRTFFETNEIIELFVGYKVLHQWKGLGKKHRHGNGPVEQHSMIELVLRKS